MPTVPLLASVADLTASVTSGGASQLVPSGVVMAFAGATAPTGWLLCEGAAISRTTYASLFSAISTAHGYGDNSTTFNLPDYRGRFIRGRDNSATRDPDRASRAAAATGGNSGDAVGSVQVFATRAPTTAFTVSTPTITSSVPMSNGGSSNGMWHNTPGTSAAAGDGNANGGTLSAGAGSHGHTITGGDNETRPVNVYVNYIIKI